MELADTRSSVSAPSHQERNQDSHKGSGVSANAGSPHQQENLESHKELGTVSANAGLEENPSLTQDNVLAATETLELTPPSTDTSVEGGLERCLKLPEDKWKDLRTKHDDIQYRRHVVDYYVKISPHASWKGLHHRALHWEKVAAAERVEQHIKREEDPSLTATILIQILEQVESDQLGLFCKHLGISVSSYYSLVAQGVKALADYYITNVKSASWHQVATALYFLKEHDSLEMLRELVPSIKRSNEFGRLFDEAMKLGYIDSRNSKIILYGAAGAGKTSSADLFLGNDPATKRISTPLAARPVTMFQIDMNHRKWERLPFKKKKEMLAQIISTRTKLQEEENESGDGSGSEDGIDGEVTTAETDANAVSSETSLETKTSSTHTTSQTHLVALQFKKKKSSSQAVNLSHNTCGNLMELTVNCESPKTPITSFYRLYLVDSGGQPQFHEILPIFLRRMNLYIYVLKLSEELSTKPMVEYYDSSGKPVGKPYQSYLSNKQLLRHCLRTLQSHRYSKKGKEKSSKIMIIGTHRDEEGKCQTETREAKNEMLANILLPTFEDEVIYFNMETQEFIFPVNARDPQSEDKKLAEGIHDIILSKCCSDTIQLPLQYYGLEIVLEELSRAQGRGFLSKQECLEAACEFQFNEHTLDAALQFLNEYSVVFYFPEHLGNVVFTNSQVLLDKVTELVEAIHSESTMCTSDWHKFKKHGIFTVEFLCQKEFVKHYLEGVFTAVELVKLFRGLFIIAEFSITGSSTDFFMPALLPLLQDESLNKYRVSSECPAAALALDFPHGGPRLGIFCSLTCFLVSPENHFPVPWKIKLQRNIPTCLTRNCIQFCIPHHPGTITLIDTFTHFEIHFSIPAATAEMCPEICSFIIQAITVGVKKASFTLGYNNSEPSLSLVCPCGKGDPHTASFNKQFWICSQDEDMAGKLTSRHLMWQMKDENDKAASLSTNLSMKDHFEITQLLEDLNPEQLRSVGGALGLSYPKMLRMKTLPEDMVAAWLMQQDNVNETSGCPSWTSLVEALKTVGQHGIASKIKNEYKKHESSISS